MLVRKLAVRCGFEGGGGGLSEKMFPGSLSLTMPWRFNVYPDYRSSLLAFFIRFV